MSTTFRGSVAKLGVAAGAAPYRAVSATVRALAASDLPGARDFETPFAPGKAYARRVTGQNLWLLYRFDDQFVFVMTARDQPPVPADP
ncbi:MAG: hypothetical protein ACRENE_08870 [Polyangiaceae bacterium]